MKEINNKKCSVLRTTKVNYWKLLSVEVIELDFSCNKSWYIFVELSPLPFFFSVEHAIEYKKTLLISANLKISLRKKKLTILAHWFVIRFPWVKPNNSEDLRCDVGAFSTFDLQTVRVVTGQTKIIAISMTLRGLQYLIKEEKPNGASINIKLFFALTWNPIDRVWSSLMSDCQTPIWLTAISL